MEENIVRSRPVGRPAHRDGFELEHRDEDGTVLYRYRPGQVLVATDDVPRIAGALRAEGAERVRAIHGMVIFRVPRGDAVPDVVRRLRGLDAAPVVSPNCVLAAALHDIWGAAKPAQPAEPLPPLPQGPGLPGTGVKVGIVDTGLYLHDWFEGRARRARDGDVDDDRLDEEQDGILDFEAGHGTHVAGIVLQHAPGAEVIVQSARVTGGQIDDAAANLAIVELVRDHDVDILNLSFGAIEQHGIDHEPMRQALEVARGLKPDLVVVAAAGNRDEDPHHDGHHAPHLDASGDPNEPSYPAAFDGVISVGAVDDHRHVPAFSVSADWVTCYSRGTDVDSTFIHRPMGKRALEPREDGRPLVVDEVAFDGFARGTGTSFAAPRVTGAIAAAMSPNGQRTRNARAAQSYVLQRAGRGRIVDPLNYVLQGAGRAPIVAPLDYEKR